jgi:hypothetical protein
MSLGCGYPVMLMRSHNGNVPRSVRRLRVRVLRALLYGFLWKAATALDSQHIAVHTRPAPPIARDSRHRSPDAHSFQPRRARSRARFACAALPPLGAAKPARPPSCHGRARRCRSRGSGSREGPERAGRVGGRAAIGASCTVEAGPWRSRQESYVHRAFAPFLPSSSSVQGPSTEVRERSRERDQAPQATRAQATRAKLKAVPSATLAGRRGARCRFSL